MEPSSKPLDLAPPGALGHRYVVVARRDLVGRRRKCIERPRDAARVVEDDDAGNRNPDPERERELPHELQPAATQRRLGLRDDERPRMDAAELDFLRNAEIGRAVHVEVESRRLSVPERRGRQDAALEHGQRASEQ